MFKWPKVLLHSSIAAFMTIVLTVRYGHPLSANTSAASVQEIANTEDPYPVAVPSAYRHG